jgi:hypothetical protein
VAVVSHVIVMGDDAEKVSPPTGLVSVKTGAPPVIANGPLSLVIKPSHDQYLRRIV